MRGSFSFRGTCKCKEPLEKREGSEGHRVRALEIVGSLSHMMCGSFLIFKGFVVVVVGLNFPDHLLLLRDLVSQKYQMPLPDSSPLEL